MDFVWDLEPELSLILSVLPAVWAMSYVFGFACRGDVKSVSLPQFDAFLRYRLMLKCGESFEAFGPIRVHVQRRRLYVEEFR